MKWKTMPNEIPRHCHTASASCVKVLFLMVAHPGAEAQASQPIPLYCPACALEVRDPLTCGDCSAVICRRCGTPLESPDELGIG